MKAERNNIRGDSGGEMSVAAIYALRFQSLLPTRCLSWGKEVFFSPSNLFPAWSRTGTVQLPHSSLHAKEGGETCCFTPCVYKAFLLAVQSGDGEGEGVFSASPLTFCPFLSSVSSPMLVVTFLPFAVCSPNTCCILCLCLFSFNPCDRSVTDPHCNFSKSKPFILN